MCKGERAGEGDRARESVRGSVCVGERERGRASV